MKMKNKKTIILSLVMVFSIFLTSCSRGNSEPFATEDGNILQYNDVAELPDGYFVKKQNGVIEPVLSKGVYQKEETTIVWYSKFDKLVPILQPGDELIRVDSYSFKNNEPAKFKKMRDVGYTIGALFDVNMSRLDDGKLDPKINFSGEFSPYSPASEAVKVTMGSNASEPLIDVNGQDFTPNMLSPGGLLQGLTKDAMYQFRYYVGTKYQLINMKADTHAFESERELKSDALIEEKSTYFTVPLPNSIEDGYYVIEDFGMFYYDSTGNTNNNDN